MAKLVLELTTEEARAIEKAAQQSGKQPAEWAREMVAIAAFPVIQDHVDGQAGEKLQPLTIFPASMEPEQAIGDEDPKRPRIPGLHAGCAWIAEDFDAPLPDEFWLGEE